MCGIAGFVGRGTQATLERMTDILRHRGPDAGRVWFKEDPATGVATGLGHRRLSIIDLSDLGTQPMATLDGRYWIVFNGEIYNYAEIRRELLGQGWRFRSQTDTEVLLNGYAQWGEGILNRLNGIFAFAIWDTRERELFLARDHLGVKPLYYTQTAGTFVFASEIKSLLQYPAIERRIDPIALHQYLSFLWVPDPRTMFDGIAKLQAGHHARLRDGKMNIAEYWDCAEMAHAPMRGGVGEYTERVHDLLESAVHAQLVADVPLGAFLSGGIDSSAVVGLMSGKHRRPSTYTVGFTAEDLSYEIVDDDVRYARIVAQQFDCDYHEIILKPQVAQLMPKIIWHMDEPVADPAAISAYLICQAARESLTVMLNGQGGDEVFAGYPRHRAVRYAELYNRAPNVLRNGLLPWLINPLPAARTGRLSRTIRNLKKFSRSASLPFHERYLGYLTHFPEDQKLALYADPLRRILTDVDANMTHRAHLAKVSDCDPVTQMCYLDLKTFLPSLNLTYTDKMSMAHAIEVRVPFLDRRLVEYALAIPGEWKLRRSVSKYVLKKSMEGLLSNEVIYRKKAGFTAPIRGWLQRELHPLVENWLTTDAITQRGLFEPASARELIQDFRSGREDNAWKIWQLLTLELWMRTFIDGNGQQPVSIDVPVGPVEAAPGRARRARETRPEEVGGSVTLPRPQSLSRKRLWEKTPPRLKKTLTPLIHALPPESWLGRRFRNHLRQAREMDRWSAERARAYQVEKLQQLCATAYQGSEFYKEAFNRAGFCPDDLRDPSDLRVLPTIDKGTIREHLSRMCTISPNSSGIDHVSTGGTSGEPLHFYIGANRSDAEYAYLVASWERAGYRLDTPQVVIRGQIVPEDVQSGLRYAYDPLLRRYHYSGFHMTEENMARYLDHLATIGECYLHVYPSSLLMLARYLLRHGRRPPRNIRGILAGSENVYAQDRALVEKAFGLRTFSWYGHSEKLVLAAECERSADYHVWPTYGYFELLDDHGHPVARPGDRGEIVGTGFINHVVPFIRYRTGDYATYVGERCAKCGREHPVIRDVCGHRSQEMLVADDGSIIPWTAINMHDDTFLRVQQFQFRQDQPGIAVLRIVPARGFAEEDRHRINRQLGGKLDGRLRFTIELVPEIQLTRSGKSTYVDQQIELEQLTTYREVLA